MMRGKRALRDKKLPITPRTWHYHLQKKGSKFGQKKNEGLRFRTGHYHLFQKLDFFDQTRLAEISSKTPLFCLVDDYFLRKGYFSENDRPGWYHLSKRGSKKNKGQKKTRVKMTDDNASSEGLCTKRLLVSRIP